MLEIINNLKPFFEDCYRELGVREYAREIKISPPAASQKLKYFEKEGLLKKRKERSSLLFRASRESKILEDLSRIYWGIRLKKLVEHLNLKYFNPAIILFGSLSKLEARKESDIDICLFSNLRKKLSLSKFEKIYGRKIQLFIFGSLDKINKELKNNIINGYFLRGEIE